MQHQTGMQLNVARQIAPEAQRSVDTLRGHHLLGGVQRDDLLPGPAGDLDACLDQPQAHATPRAWGSTASSRTLAWPGCSAPGPVDRPVELHGGRTDDAPAATATSTVANPARQATSASTPK